MQPPQELLDAHRALAAQIGATFILVHSFFIQFVIVVAVAFDCRRFALLLFALYGFITFWIPSGVTMIVSPAIFLAGLGGFVFEQFVRLPTQRAIAMEQSRDAYPIAARKQDDARPPEE